MNSGFDPSNIKYLSHISSQGDSSEMINPSQMTQMQTGIHSSSYNSKTNTSVPGPYPSIGNQLNQPYSSTINMDNTTNLQKTQPYNPNSLPAININFKGVPGCTKCNGSGFKTSKKHGKTKPCKICIKSTGFCPKCNGTGFKIKNKKECKCKKILH